MKCFSVLVFAVVLSAASLSRAGSSPSGYVMQFNKGDIVPLTYTMAGDFVETVQPSQIQLIAKQTMWVRVAGDDVYVSLDGKLFKPFTQVVSGQLDVGADETNGFMVGLTLKSK